MFIETVGIVKDIRSKGLDFPTVVTVEYCVDGKTYTIQEALQLKNRVIKLGFLPIGHRLSPKVKCEKDGEVIIIYDEKNPNKGHIKDNDGIINC